MEVPDPPGWEIGVLQTHHPDYQQAFQCIENASHYYITACPTDVGVTVLGWKTAFINVRQDIM